MCYKSLMDTTVRNLDEEAYRRLKAWSALTGKTIGEALNEAIRAFLARPDLSAKRGSLKDLVPESYGRGSERLSEQIDSIVFGK